MIPAPSQVGTDRLDLRLVPAAATTWLVTLVAPSASSAVQVAGAATCLLLAIGLALRCRHRLAVAGAVALACGAAGALAVLTRAVALHAGPLHELAAQRADARLEVVVQSDARPVTTRRLSMDVAARRTWVLDVRAERLGARSQVTSVRTPLVVLATDEAWVQVLPGTRVAVAGRLAPADATAAALLLARGPPRILESADPVQRTAGRLRAGLRTAVSMLPPAERGLVPGLVVGDTAGLTDELRDDFQTAGLTHLTAVSGANVAIVCGAVLVAARWLGAGRRTAAVVAALALVGFVVLARPQPSVLRAGVMGAVGLLALASGRRRVAVPALAVACLVLLLIDPALGRSYGFALSVLATAGIVLLATPWSTALARRGVPWPLAAAVAVPTAAQLACAPVVAMLTGSVSLIAVAANLAVAAAVAPATLLGVAAAVVAPIAAPAAALLGRLAGLPAGWIVRVAERCADVPHAAVGWPSGGRGAVLLAVVLAAAASALRVLSPRVAGHRRAALAVAIVLVLGTATLARSPRGWPPPGWLLVACDVGQGDALVLATGGDDAVVVDAGPDPQAVDGCLRRLGVRSVALVLLTHLHADHVDGLAGVLRNRRVGQIEVGPLDEPGDSASAVARLAAAAGVPVIRTAPGHRRTLGAVSLEVLWPRRVIRGEGSEPNNASIVLLMRTGPVRVLLTGDVERAAQEALRPVVADALGGTPVDVLKVAHHGSASQSPALLRALAARLALVSVGSDNTYGHPAAPTLELLRQAGSRVLRTDQAGDIAVVTGADGLSAVTRGR